MRHLRLWSAAMLLLLPTGLAAGCTPSAQRIEIKIHYSHFDPSALTVPSGVPVTFASFVISLGSSSLMLMGEQLDPQQPAMPVNLPQAKEIIDLLSVLDVKTKGNLTTEEQTVLRDMLYALRMKYVSLTSK